MQWSEFTCFIYAAPEFAWAENNRDVSIEIERWKGHKLHYKPRANDLKGQFAPEWKCRHHLLTIIMLFQSCMDTTEDILK